MDAASKARHEEAHHQDWLHSSNNIALTLLQSTPRIKTPTCSLSLRIQALPQELQDEIHDYTVLEIHQSLHWISTSILDNARTARPPPSELELFKLDSLVHHSNELFSNKTDAIDYLHIMGQLVRIFAVHPSATIIFLKELELVLGRSSLLEAAAIIRISMLAIQCATLRSTFLTFKGLPILLDLRFKDIDDLDKDRKTDDSDENTNTLAGDLCVVITPEFLTHTVRYGVWGRAQRSQKENLNFDMSGRQPRSEALVMVEGAKSYTWLQVGMGAWYFTTDPPVVKDIDDVGWYGSVEWEVVCSDSASIRVVVPCRQDMVFDRWWKSTDPQGALEAQRKRDIAWDEKRRRWGWG